MAVYSKQFIESLNRSNEPEWQRVGDATIAFGKIEASIGTLWIKKGELFLRTKPSIHGKGEIIKLKFNEERKQNETQN